MHTHVNLEGGRERENIECLNTTFCKALPYIFLQEGSVISSHVLPFLLLLLQLLEVVLHIRSRWKHRAGCVMATLNSLHSVHQIGNYEVYLKSLHVFIYMAFQTEQHMSTCTSVPLQASVQFNKASLIIDPTFWTVSWESLKLSRVRFVLANSKR